MTTRPGPGALHMLAKATANPSKAISYGVSALRSRWCVFKYQHLLRRAEFGKNFRLSPGGSLVIAGPGRVVIGNDVLIGMRVTPWTYDRNATITIGDGTFVNGTRFACQKLISIGRKCILAECRIMDTDFHGVDPKNRESFASNPIVIGDNVWITINAVILKGITVGSGSTVTPNSVVTRDVPENSIVSGNPARVIKSFSPPGVMTATE